MERVYEEDLALVQEKWSSLERGIPVTFEMRWKAKPSAVAGRGSDSEPIWISAACVPVMSKDGALASISGFTTDISASKRDAQNMLERARILERAESSELRFAKFAELAPVAIFILDDYKTVGNL
jgi:PAS domain-containing protein